MRWRLGRTGKEDKRVTSPGPRQAWSHHLGLCLEKCGTQVDSSNSQELGKWEVTKAGLTDFSVILINRPDRNSLSSKNCFSLKHRNQGWEGRWGHQYHFSDERPLSLRNQCHFIPQDLGLANCGQGLNEPMDVAVRSVSGARPNSPAHACRCRDCVARKPYAYGLLALYRHGTLTPALQPASLSASSPENLKSIHARPCCKNLLI